MQARDDGLCSFCGTDVGVFPVCRGCNAEKIYSEPNTKNIRYETFYFSILNSILLYYRINIIAFLDLFLADFGEIPYYLTLGLALSGGAFIIHDWFNLRTFRGPGWKKR